MVGLLISYAPLPFLAPSDPSHAPWPCWCPMLDPLLRLNTKSCCHISASKTPCPISLSSPTSSSTHIQGLPLSLQGPTIKSPLTQPQWLRTGLPQDPHPANPSQPQGRRWTEGPRSQHCIQRLWGFEYNIERCPAEGLRASLAPVPIGLQRLKTSRGFSSWCPSCRLWAQGASDQMHRCSSELIVWWAFCSQGRENTAVLGHDSS